MAASVRLVLRSYTPDDVSRLRSAVADLSDQDLARAAAGIPEPDLRAITKDLLNASLRKVNPTTAAQLRRAMLALEDDAFCKWATLLLARCVTQPFRLALGDSADSPNFGEMCEALPAVELELGERLTRAGLAACALQNLNALPAILQMFESGPLATDAKQEERLTTIEVQLERLGDLQRRFPGALQVVDSMAAALRAGRLPGAQSLEELTSLRSDVVDFVAECGFEADEQFALDDVEALLEERRSAAALDARKPALERLRSMTSEIDLFQADLNPVVEEIALILDNWPPDAAEEELVTALVDIREAFEHGLSADAAADLSVRVPARLRWLPAAIVAGQVELRLGNIDEVPAPPAQEVAVVSRSDGEDLGEISPATTRQNLRTPRSDAAEMIDVLAPVPAPAPADAPSASAVDPSMRTESSGPGTGRIAVATDPPAQDERPAAREEAVEALATDHQAETMPDSVENQAVSDLSAFAPGAPASTANATTDGSAHAMSTDGERLKSGSPSASSEDRLDSHDGLGTVHSSSPGPEQDAILQSLVDQGEFAVASWVLPARSFEADMFAFAAVVDAISDPTGELTAEAKQRADDLARRAAIDEVPDGELVVLAAATAAYLARSPLLRSTELEDWLLEHVARASSMSTLISALRDLAASGEAFRPVGREGEDVTEGLAAAIAEAEGLLAGAAHRTNRYAFGTVVLQRLAEPGGVIGTILSDAIAVGRSRTPSKEALGRVEARIADLRQRKAVEELVDQVGSASDPSGRRRIIGKARQELIKSVNDALNVASSVCALVAAGLGGDDRGSFYALAAKKVDDSLALAIEEVGTSGPPDAWSATARVVLARLREQAPQSRSKSVTEVLVRPLLRVPGISVDPSVTVITRPDWASASRFLNGVSPLEAFDECLARGDFVTSDLMIEDGLIDSELRTRQDDLLAERRAKVSARLRKAESLLARRVVEGVVDEQTAFEIELILLGAESVETRADMHLIEERVAGAEVLLNDAVLAAVDARRLKVDALDIEGAMPGEQREALDRALASADLVSVDLLIELAEQGTVFANPTGGRALEEFLPFLDVATENAGREVTAWLTDARLRVDREFPERPESQRMLQLWNRLHGLSLDFLGGNLANPATDLRRELGSLLPLIGLEGGNIPERQPGSGKGRGRLWFQVNRATPRGKCLTPDFGTAADGTYRVLFVAGEVTGRELFTLIDQDRSNDPLIVVNTGTLSASERRDFTERMRQSNLPRPTAIVDDATIAWLAAGERDWEATMIATLPFNALNPYRPNAQGELPREMFFGRAKELRELLDPMGPTFVYGGRQLGKSALLRKARRRAVSRGDCAVVIDLNYVGADGDDSTVAVWRHILLELRREMALSTKAPPPNKKDVFDDVAAVIGGWLEQNPGKRVFVMLDECDKFLDQDSREDYAQTQRIRGLMQETKRRFKCVLAGLHQVQRFERDSNQPLAHLSQTPIRVGSLDPKDALDLVKRPLEWIGYRFATPELPLRILGFSNLHASVLQLIGAEVANRMLDVRRRDGAPPVIITNDIVDSVLASAALQEEIRRRFEWTLNLDQRYRLIAYLFAISAHDRGIDAEITIADLAAEIRTTWPTTLGDLCVDDLRGLLDEMIGLGTIRRTRSRNYTLRNPNVLRLLGTYDDVVDRLTSPGAFEAEASPLPSMRRMAVHGGAPSPLTSLHIRTVFDQRCSILVGAPVSGFDQILPALELAGESLGVRINQVLRREQVDPSPGTLNVIRVVDDGTPSAEAAQVVLADELARGVFLVDYGTFPELGTGPDIEVQWCNRWSRTELANWLRDDLADHWIDRILERSGGWHCLVEAWLRGFRSSHEPEAGDAATEAWLHERDTDGLMVFGVAPDSEFERVLAALRGLGEFETDDLHVSLEVATEYVGAIGIWAEHASEVIRQVFLAVRDGTVGVDPIVSRVLDGVTPGA